MRRLFPLSLVAAAALLSRSAVAEDPKTFTLPTAETFKVGDVVTRHESETTTNKRVVKSADGATVIQPEVTEVETVEQDRVTKVLEVDDKGQVTKAIVYFKKWSQKKGETADDTLTGKHVEVSGIGATGSAKVITPDANVSPAAIEWINKELVKEPVKHSKMDAVLHPGKAVAVGESWSPSAADVVKAITGEEEGAPKIVADKSSVKITLSEATADAATLAAEMHLQTASLPTQMGELPFKSGGAFDIQYKATTPMDAGGHAKTARRDMKFGGVALGKNEGMEFAVEFEIVGSVEESEKSGGEMPPAPEAK